MTQKNKGGRPRKFERKLDTKRYTCLTKQQAEAVDQIAKDKGVTVSTLIREIVLRQLGVSDDEQ